MGMFDHYLAEYLWPHSHDSLNNEAFKAFVKIRCHAVASTRKRSAVKEMGIDAETLKKFTIPVRGRILHTQDGTRMPFPTDRKGRCVMMYMCQRWTNSSPRSKCGLEGFWPTLRSSPIDHMCAQYSAIADDKLVTQTSLVKKWTPQQKVQCVLWLAEFKSVTRVQRRVRTKWNVDSPTTKSIHRWERTLMESRTRELWYLKLASILKFS
ncbi:uncharacterized protein TNCV_2518661 [Trichonephila clavipes]|nr:uncharacterized protein TNCV_2518661 [Trichonephila clavipes]